LAYYVGRPVLFQGELSLLLQGHAVVGQGVMALKCRRVDLD